MSTIIYCSFTPSSTQYAVWIHNAKCYNHIPIEVKTRKLLLFKIYCAKIDADMMWAIKLRFPIGRRETIQERLVKLENSWMTSLILEISGIRSSNFYLLLKWFIDKKLSRTCVRELWKRYFLKNLRTCIKTIKGMCEIWARVGGFKSCNLPTYNGEIWKSEVSKVKKFSR